MIKLLASTVKLRYANETSDRHLGERCTAVKMEKDGPWGILSPELRRLSSVIGYSLDEAFHAKKSKHYGQSKCKKETLSLS